MPGENIFIQNTNGASVKGSILRNSQVERSKIACNKELNILFDYYNKYDASLSKNILDSRGLARAFRDIASASGNDNTLVKEEITKFLKEKNLLGKVSEDTVIEFFAKVGDYSTVNALYNSISGVGMKSVTKDYLKGINSKNIFNILDLYKKENNVSIIQHIANESATLGTTRKSYLNIIRDKIAQTMDGKDASEFVEDFNKITEKMNMTIFSESNASELEELIDLQQIKIKTTEEKKKEPKYPRPEKKDPATLERLNRSLIAQMMDNGDLCRTDTDKKIIIDRIMKYAKLNNPEKMIARFLKSENPKVRQAAQNLKNSTFLDYFPIFVASIIAQESQFRETDNNPKTGVFTVNGKGVMQITRSLAQDIYDRPQTFDENFLKRLEKIYNCKDSTTLYNALKNEKNVKINLHYDVGTAGLSNKLYTLFFQIADGTFDKMKVDMTNPATILEFVAMNYNGNLSGKKDEKHEDSISQVRYVYGRDVIERFRRYTPADVKIRKYFDHNPKTKKFNTVQY